MTERMFERLVGGLEGSLSAPGARPSLLFSEEDVAALRQRASARPELCDGVMRRARDIVSAGDLSTQPEPYYSSLPLLEALMAAQMLEPSAEVASHMVLLLRAVAQAPTWVCHVHGGMRCDHCAANTASALARAADVLGPALPEEVEQLVARRVWELCLHPFIEVCRARSLFWARRDHPFNWRIMTCGESGLAALAFPAPDRLEAVRFALEGVADILDRIPEDGDWEEGPGYWAATLLHGLRFAVALHRLTGGRIDLFEHPSLPKTADYFTAITLPDGTVFNYADNAPRLTPTVLHLLAGRLRLGHLAWTARRIGYRSVWDLLFDDPSVAAVEPPAELQARTFSATGVAVSRSGWEKDAVFVGFKTGPTAVGHSHLDVHSFVLHRGDVPLVIDPGIWPYGSALGFFDSVPGGRRWDFDANATLAHNTVLVDGQGQTCCPDCGGTFIASGADGGLRYFISEAARAYPGLLSRFERWVVHVLPDIVVIYDALASDQERRWQWLIHPAGTARVGRSTFVIENEGMRLSLVRLLPAADTPWRNVSETRTSYYQDSDSFEDVERTITGYRMGPMMPSKSVEFLWVLHPGGPAAGQWSVERDGDALLVRGPVGVRLERAAHRCSVLQTQGKPPDARG